MQGEDLSRHVAKIELRIDSHYTDRVVSLERRYCAECRRS